MSFYVFINFFVRHIKSNIPTNHDQCVYLSVGGFDLPLERRLIMQRAGFQLRAQCSAAFLAATARPRLICIISSGARTAVPVASRPS